eukprot:3843063-Ditylum_brightwellii.AAC.1
MGEAALVLLFVITELAAAAFINKLQVGDVCCVDNHVVPKHNLARRSGKVCVVGGAEGESNALQHLIYLFGGRGNGMAV